MPSENNSSRKLAAILFADIVGYTAMMQSDEGQTMSRLRHYQQILQSAVDQHNGQIIKNYGDGSLCVFTSVLDSVNCAKQVQETLNKEPKVPLRIGLHLGDIMYEGDDIYGDALNVASRIESMGVAGAVLLSNDVYKKVKNQTDLQFRSLGGFEFKNVDEPMEIYALSNDGFAVPKVDEIQGKFKSKKLSTSKWMVPGVVGALLLSVLIYWFGFYKSNNATTAVQPSIAVLPFEDMSPEKDQEYFGDGIAEEILNSLVKLKDLKVAGRTSSFSFKGKDATIEEIGNNLNVNHILEGSVRKQGDKVRITAQLIKVEDGFHLWSEKFDRDFDDVFAIQDELAEGIAKVLLEKLAPQDLAKIQSNAPNNSQAYDLFLRAKHEHMNGYIMNNEDESFKLSERLFRNAIDLDPNYVDAYAGIADLYDTRLDFETDSSRFAIHDSLRWYYMNEGLKINTESAYLNEILGYLYRNFNGEVIDTEAAFNSFIKSYQLNPYSPNCLRGLSGGYGGIGLYDDALVISNRALELDPLFQVAISNRSQILYRLGQFEEALEINNKILEKQPNDLHVIRRKANILISLRRNKDASEAYRKLKSLNPEVFKIVNGEEYLAVLEGGGDDVINGLKAKSLNEDPASYFLLAELYFIKDDLKNYDIVIKDLSANRINNTSDRSRSNYLSFMNSFANDRFQDEPWWQELMHFEKEIYDELKARYPSAEEVLGE